MTKGQVIRTYWYEPGIEHGNPFFSRRFRVNAPEASLNPRFMYWDEVQENGMMQIRIEEDLAQLDGAALYCEIWGGHPGTASKRVSINGRSTYLLPEVGTASGQCTHQYPTLPLQLTDLVNGYNAIQFACDQGSSFWGHFIVDNACLRLALKPEHPDLQACGLSGFRAEVHARPVAQGLVLGCAYPDSWSGRIAGVDYYGTYDGYDENGSKRTVDWHGFTKGRLPVAHLGTVREPPFELVWDTSMLLVSSELAVRASVRFEGQPAESYETPVLSGVEAPGGGLCVRRIAATDQPVPFWSRAGREMRCSLDLDVDPADVEHAVLHVVIWDGGRGEVDAPFTLNGVPLPVAGEGNHDVLYRQMEIDPSLLRRGQNEVRLLSDTEHHGIEVLQPGPELMARLKGA